MARLQFGVRADYGTNNDLTVFVNNPNGTPEFNLNGNAWQSFNGPGALGFFKFLVLPPVGVVEINYRDNDGERKLCDFNITNTLLTPCLFQSVGFFVGYVGAGSDGIVLSTSVPLIIAPGGGSITLPICASLDGFINQVCGSSTNSASTNSLPPPLQIPSGASSVSFSYRTQDGSCSPEIASNILTEELILPLSVDCTKEDVTVVGGSDGKITIIANGGSGNYEYDWDDLVDFNSAIRVNLPIGSYTVTVKDLVTMLTIQKTVFIEQPALIPTEIDPYFEVPKTQSLHFVIQESPDNCNIFQGLDNVLLRNQKHYDFQGLDYCIKKNQRDSFKIQFRSNLDLHECKLMDFEGNEIDSYIPQLVINNINQTEDFNIRIQNNGSGQSRVYFIGESSIPLPVESGQSFEIFNNGDSFNGIYNIISIETDVVLGQQYLLINMNYIIGAPSSIALARFVNEVINFNIWEFVVSFLTISRGCYYMSIRAFNDSGFDQIAESEPIHLESSHKKTHKIEFTNIDNAFDIDYQNNIAHSVRVESFFFQRLPSGDSDTLRNTNGSLGLLSSKPQRKVNLQFFNLPPYLHELLFLAFKHDVITVDGVSVKAEESLSEPEYRDRYALANSSIIVEQSEWFGTYNGDDLGGISIEGGFVLANNGFIKRT